MLVEFDGKRDKAKVQCYGPWTFSKQLVSTQDFDSQLQVQEIRMTKADFWVRIHNLPLMVFIEYVG